VIATEFAGQNTKGQSARWGQRPISPSGRQSEFRTSFTPETKGERSEWPKSREQVAN
jgi:hypothetical protein